MLKLIVLLYSVYVSEGSSILVVFPVPEKSHSVLGDSLVRTLLDAGHEVTYVTPFPQEELPHLEYVDIASVLGIPDKEKLNEKDVTKELHMERVGARASQLALQHHSTQQLMLNTSRRYDVILAEWFYTGLLAPLSSIFECPLIWYSCTDASASSLSLVHAASTAAPADMSILDKVYKMCSQLYLAYRNYYHFSTVEMSAYEQSYRPAFEHRREVLPNYELVVHNASMLLINSHPLLGEKLSLPPNAKYIEPAHVEQLRRLELSTLTQYPNLKKLIDDSYEGVIYVDLESNLISSDVQESLTQELMDVLGQLKQTVVWKSEEVLVNLPENVYTMKKPPHHSILNHVNTLIFVTHGEMSAILSAMNYGVPVIGIPLLEDHLSNMKLVVERGRGVSVNVKDVSWKVAGAVGKLLGNISYQENTKFAKSILRHRLISPREEFLYWVQVVIDSRGAAHLRAPAQASILERYNLDILLLIILFLWFCTKITKLVKVHFTEEDLEKKDA